MFERIIENSLYSRVGFTVFKSLRKNLQELVSIDKVKYNFRKNWFSMPHLKKKCPFILKHESSNHVCIFLFNLYILLQKTTLSINNNAKTDIAHISRLEVNKNIFISVLDDKIYYSSRAHSKATGML